MQKLVSDRPVPAIVRRQGSELVIETHDGIGPVFQRVTPKEWEAAASIAVNVGHVVSGWETVNIARIGDALMVRRADGTRETHKVVGWAVGKTNCDATNRVQELLKLQRLTPGENLELAHLLNVVWVRT